MSKVHSINYSDTGFFSEQIVRYVKGDAALKPFYNLAPVMESFAKAIDLKAKENCNRELLVTVLLEQNKQCHANSINNIKSLGDKNTFTVCTGHQLCLFTGPLYFIYKILSTINLAEELQQKYPENKFVPVYWMASEDHDFEEINHIRVFGKIISWSKEEATANEATAAGKIKTKSLQKVFEELSALIGGDAKGQAFISRLEAMYMGSENLAEATRSLVNELFGTYGLVIMDADDSRLKKEFAPILSDDIFNNTNADLVNDSIQKLSEQGIKAKVNPRSINVFYLTEKFRQRIEKNKDGNFAIVNTNIVFTAEQLKNELEQHPERFSPNVVLRPLYQEKTLPNIAYVGGAGELSYWMEYKKMFDRHNTFFPILMLRNSILFVDEASSQKIKKLNLSVADFFTETELLIKQYVADLASANNNFEAEEQALKKLYENISNKVAVVDITLKASVDADLQKALNGLKAMEQKLLRAEKQKHETAIAQIKKLKEKLFPDNVLQERAENFMPYYIKNGSSYIEILKENCKPFDGKFIVFEQ